LFNIPNAVVWWWLTAGGPYTAIVFSVVPLGCLTVFLVFDCRWLSVSFCSHNCDFAEKPYRRWFFARLLVQGGFLRHWATSFDPL